MIPFTYRNFFDDIELQSLKEELFLNEIGIKLPLEIQKQIVDLYQSGVTTSEILKKLNVSVYNVYSVLKKAGIKPKNQHAVKPIHKQIVDLYQNGVAVSEILKKLNVTPHSVYAALKKAGIKPKNQQPLHRLKIKPEGLKQIKDLYDSGMTIYEIAKKLGVTHQAISLIFKKLGIVSRTLKKLTPEQEKEVIELYNNGIEIEKIAKKFGVSYVTTNKVIDNAIKSNVTKLRVKPV